MLRPDPSLWDGSFANNAWLQECPKPLTKQVWGNALALNPQDAARRGLRSGDVVTLSCEWTTDRGAGHRRTRHSRGVISLTLGLGRRKAGAIGNGIGANAFALRTTAHAWTIPGCDDREDRRRGRRSSPPRTWSARAEDVRELYPLHDLAEASQAASRPSARNPACCRSGPSRMTATPGRW